MSSQRRHVGKGMGSIPGEAVNQGAIFEPPSIDSNRTALC